jgi:hypothetical protein
LTPWRLYVGSKPTADLGCELREEYYIDGAAVLRVALKVPVVLLVMFFVFEARKHAGSQMD